eukprot:Clim_evm2s228 gene=Clim_evmTU2s228
MLPLLKQLAHKGICGRDLEVLVQQQKAAGLATPCGEAQTNEEKPQSKEADTISCSSTGSTDTGILEHVEDEEDHGDPDNDRGRERDQDGTTEFSLNINKALKLSNALLHAAETARSRVDLSLLSHRSSTDLNQQHSSMGALDRLRLSRDSGTRRMVQISSENDHTYFPLADDRHLHQPRRSHSYIHRRKSPARDRSSLGMVVDKAAPKQEPSVEDEDDDSEVKAVSKSMHPYDADTGETLLIGREEEDESVEEALKFVEDRLLLAPDRTLRDAHPQWGTLLELYPDRNIQVHCVTFNTNEQMPPEHDVEQMVALLGSVGVRDGHDIVAIGLQEQSKHWEHWDRVLRSMMCGSDNEWQQPQPQDNGDVTGRDSAQEGNGQMHKKTTLTFADVFASHGRYTAIRMQRMYWLYMIVFVRKELVPFIYNVQSTSVATGIGGVVGNKGGTAISFRLADTSFVFVNCHLPAHQGEVTKRRLCIEKICRACAVSEDKVVPTSLAQRSGTPNPASTVPLRSVASQGSADLILSRSSLRSNFSLATRSSSPSIQQQPTGDDKDEDRPTANPRESRVSPTRSPTRLSGFMRRLSRSKSTEPPQHRSKSGAPLLVSPMSQSTDSTEANPAGELPGVIRESVTGDLMPASLRADLTTRFDRVCWFGDMNYRVDGSRKIVDAVIRNGMLEVLHANDQLRKEMRRGRVLQGFQEGELLFAPTYKFDNGTDIYDTSKKCRIPSYTDRILFRCPRDETDPFGRAMMGKPLDLDFDVKDEDADAVASMRLVDYNTAFDVKLSDHKPVYATMEADLKLTDPYEVDPFLA